MTDQLSQREIIGAAHWDTALFTTYSLSLSFFEAVPLHALRRSGCRSVSILADAEGYRSSLSEAGAEQAGRSYALAPIMVKNGIFHPKLMMLSSPDQIVASIGSGNLTFSGWGGNFELVDFISPELAPVAFGDLAEFFDALSREQKVMAHTLPDIDHFTRKCRIASRAGTAARVRVLHSISVSIEEQLATHADALGGAISASVVSPFFGSPEPILSLAQSLNLEEIHVCVPLSAPEFYPFNDVVGSTVRVKPVISESFSDPKRRLHAKAIDIACRRGRILFTGSVNATRPALCEARNIEIGVLRLLDAPDIYGWTPTTNTMGDVVNGSPPRSLSRPILIAESEGQKVSGRIFGHKPTASMWQATLLSGGRSSLISAAVKIAGDGSFDLSVPDLTLEWRTAESVQLELSADDVRIRGWLMMTSYLAAIKERGPIVETILRVASGSDDPEDLSSVLEFFTKNPETLIGEDRATGGTNTQESGAHEPSGYTNLSELNPSHFPAVIGSEVPSSSARSAFEHLVARLRLRISQHEDPETPDDDEDDPGADRKAHKQKTRANKAKLYHSLFEALFEQFKSRITKEPINNTNTRHALTVLLDLGLFLFARIEDSFQQRADFLDEWRRLTLAYCYGTPNGDELDRRLVFVVTADVIPSPHRADQALASLQKYVKGHLPAIWTAAVAPSAAHGLARALVREATSSDWTRAFHLLCNSTTPWMQAQAIWDSLVHKHPFEVVGTFLSPDEIELIQLVKVQARPRQYIQAITDVRDIGFCPRCNTGLPTSETYRLQNYNVATALNCCSSVLLNLCP